MIKLERHRLGPRCYVLGQRIHEYQLGLAMLVAVAIVLVCELVRVSTTTGGLALVGTWLVMKDWRDLVPAKRDTAAWRLGFHRPPPNRSPAE
ncbi:MAG: hypothetical protein WBB74_03295 [Gaiellaceae bacterium]